MFLKTSRPSRQEVYAELLNPIKSKYNPNQSDSEIPPAVLFADMTALKYIIDKSGFELTTRIQIREKRTKKEFR